MAKQTFDDLAQVIAGLSSKHRQKLIGIDGGGGAGKSTFAKHLQSALHNAEVIHIDDFYIGPWDKRLEHTDYVVNPMFDWQRYKSEVLDRIQRDEQVTYHIYDWHEHNTNKIATVPQDAVVLVEGVYTIQKSFAAVYDYKIWIEADMDLRLQKALGRDGEHMRFLWEEDWLPVERNYIAKDNPVSRADLIVKGHSADFTQGFFETIS